MDYKVVIVEKKTGAVVKTIGEDGMSFDKAERVQRGVTINLNKRKFTTRIERLKEV